MGDVLASPDYQIKHVAMVNLSARMVFASINIFGAIIGTIAVTDPMRKIAI